RPEVEREVESGSRRLRLREDVGEGSIDAVHRVARSKLEHLARQRMGLGVAEHAREHVLNLLEPVVQDVEPVPQALVSVSDRMPRRRVGRPVDLHVETRAGEAELTLVREMPVERVALDAGETSDVAQRRPAWPFRPVQLDRRLDDAPSCLLLLLGPALQLVLFCLPSPIISRTRTTNLTT